MKILKEEFFLKFEEFFLLEWILIKNSFILTVGKLITKYFLHTYFEEPKTATVHDVQRHLH